jgi:hypothetical protein
MLNLVPTANPPSRAAVREYLQLHFRQTDGAFELEAIAAMHAVVSAAGHSVAAFGYGRLTTMLTNR